MHGDQKWHVWCDKEAGNVVKSKIKSIPGIILLRIAGLLLFISFIYIASFLSFFTDNPVNNQVIQFLNENIGLIVLLLNKNILRIFDRIELLVYSAVFIIMLIGGYMMIFHEIFKNRSASG